jgi:hypothetical protein
VTAWQFITYSSMVISSYLIARMTKQVAESVEQEYTVAAATTAAHEFFSCIRSVPLNPLHHN